MDALTGRISVRQLRVMVDHLPPDSAVDRAVRGDWGDELRILHDLNTQLRTLNANFHNANFKGTRWEVHPLPTPEDRDKQVDVRSPEQVEAERAHLQAVLSRNNST